MILNELSKKENKMVLEGKDILTQLPWEYGYHYQEENWTRYSNEEQMLIRKWVRFMFTHGKTMNKHRTSYGLKHLCESDVGFYVHNDAIKKAFILEEYTAETGNINWLFNANGQINNEKSFRFKNVFKEEIENLK